MRHIDLFQDNFAEDGTTTGTARADMAGDIMGPLNPTILPGDSAVVSVSDPDVGMGVGTNGKAAVFCYVRVDGPHGGLVSDALIDDARYTYIGTVMAGGHPWAEIQLDSSYTAGGSVVADKYNIDLNDNLFVPGDTIHFFFGAENAVGNPTYFSRKLDGQGDDFVTANRSEAGESPMEFTILPAGGWIRGGDILYVDHADDRDGPVQTFFDTAFDFLGIRDLVDRYDVLDPSSLGQNTLKSRVTNVSQQIISCYRKIIWNSGSQERGLIGDGSEFPLKSDDYSLLFSFLDQHADRPGLYLSGDNLAQEWLTLIGVSPGQLRSKYMNFNLVSGAHYLGAGEPL
ncbi:MAG: hypothetical protein KAJ17_00530, partial [Candidatus Krumholzibacteria bacterium]|nr:hypothetical protein [Candidatus Krumholzibacteria bacterium]